MLVNSCSPFRTLLLESYPKPEEQSHCISYSPCFICVFILFKYKKSPLCTNCVYTLSINLLVRRLQPPICCCLSNCPLLLTPGPLCHGRQMRDTRALTQRDSCPLQGDWGACRACQKLVKIKWSTTGYLQEKGV